MRGRAVQILLLAAGTAGLSTACAGPRAEAVIAAEHVSYEAGDVADLRLSNPMDETVGFNACTWTLELQVDSGWRAAPYEDERVCTMELRMLDPGETATPAFGLDHRLPAGNYRLRGVLHGRDSGERSVHLSEPFQIER